MSLIYKSKRVGQYGKRFDLLKFRTMKEGCHGGCPTASVDDERLTRIGKILRSTKLDELPTLYNIFKGDVNLFGYRCDVPSEIESLPEDTRQILLHYKPGLISPCTVWNSNEDCLLKGKEDPHQYYTEFIKPTKYRLAVWYYQNKTLWLDIKIFIATILNILKIPHRINCFPDWL